MCVTNAHSCSQPPECSQTPRPLVSFVIRTSPVLRLAFPQSHCKKCGFSPWVGKIPWSREWQPTPVFLPGQSRGQRSLVLCVHGVSKSQTRLSTHTHSCCVHTSALSRQRATRPGVSPTKPCPDLCAAPALSSPFLHMTGRPRALPKMQV